MSESETSPGPWIAALRRSHDNLQALVEPLGDDQLQQRSYCSDWSVAQVLSHLGSGAQIFGLFLDAGLSGQEPPGREAFQPIWEAWNTRTPQTQATDALLTDELLTRRFESLDTEQRARLRLQMWGMDLDTTGLARMRLSEHVVHTWDVAVVLDPSATVAADAVDLLVDTIGLTAARSGKPDGKPRLVHVTTTDPVRHFTLETGEAVTLSPADAGEEAGTASLASADPGMPELRLPAEALIRLVYGRLDPAHTPSAGAREVDLDNLRGIFQGF
ncbi:MAG TPA: maleylpyruvate isomerase family mycothiol-dependent enzyme [Streptosporangiaceae bacterium]|nr:maleylpyruvate isomerase family mycothiol-dependent enzyme [Streptosporangiaceae bacterium]